MRVLAIRLIWSVFIFFSSLGVVESAELVQGLGGESGFGDLAMGRNDDGSSQRIDITSVFPEGVNFFSGKYAKMHINNNGNVTFDNRVSSFTPSPFPIANRPMIAPYWGDVDTRGGLSDSEDLHSNQVYYALLGDGRIVVTWYKVGYYSANKDKYNTFQLVMTNRGDIGSGDFDVEYRYSRLEWTTGDASGGSGGLGGVPAQVGLDAGDQENYYAHPDSLTENVLGLVDTSNVGESGVWRFQVRNGVVDESPDELLSDVSVKLSVPLSVDVVSTSFSQAPVSSYKNGDDFVYEWGFESFQLSQLEEIDFDLNVPGASPGSVVPVISEVFLSYYNSKGEHIERVLGGESLNVLQYSFSGLVDVDRFSYTYNQKVKIGSNIKSLSGFDSEVDAAITIRDASGFVVADVQQLSDLYVPAGSQLSLGDSEWNTGNAYSGEYSVHLALYGQEGELVGEINKTFVIVPPTEAQTAAKITTDKRDYFPGEVVAIQQRVSNPAPNAQLNGALTSTEVYSPDETLIWDKESLLPQIGPGSLYDDEYDLDFSGTPGEYSIALNVYDPAGVLLAADNASFDILSTALDGAGLKGDIQINADPMFRSEYLTINTTVRNEGNADMSDVPVTLSIVDPETEQVVAQWQSRVDELPIEESDASSQSWLALAPIGATYAAVLTAHVGGNERILATRTFSIADKLPAAFSLEGKGRLLALVDGTAAGSCQGVGQLDLHFQPDVVLLPRDQVLLEVYSAGGDLLDAETVSIGQASGVLNNNPGTKADVAILRSSASHVAFTLAPVNQAELSSPVRVVATHWQNGNPVLHDSGLLTPDCQSLYAGLQQESYVIDQVLAIDSAEPYGPDGAPTALSQRRFLQQLLEEAGWSYTLVSTADDFVREFETGGYTVYGLFHEAVKIPESTQHELVGAVADGAGLLYAGYHDKRNGRLESALGISARGKLPKVRGIALGDSPIHAGEDSFSLALHGKPLRVQLNGANALAHYLPSGGVSATDYAYGQGRGVYMGFDVLAEATVAGLESAQASLIARALDHIHPQALSPVAGKVIPLSLTLTNQGLPVAGQVSLILPPGFEAVDVGTGRLADDGSLLWPFHIEAGQEQQWQFWIRLPDQPGEIRLQGKIDVGTDQGLVEYGPVGTGTTLDVLGQ